MSTVIHIDNVSKRYKLDPARQSYRTLREAIAASVANSVKGVRQLVGYATKWDARRTGTEDRRRDFWALRDVAFEVMQGEIVGVVGKNGAGKSTLLKVLSRITEPSHGRIEIRGRMGSLLEVGTGFHPELTGRENTFMNGSMLGMSRREIRARFGDIVEFAGLSDFIDMPVKRYSSGMYVRLAFAVAAFLEPEILLVDEVLAVGDSAFQRKCIAKMSDIRHSGRTLLVVSHNLSTLAQLCTSGVLLENGRVAERGPIVDVLRRYHQSINLDHDVPLIDRERHLRASPMISAIAIMDDDGPTNVVPLAGRFRCHVGVSISSRIDHPVVGIGIDSLGGERQLTLVSPLGAHALGALGGQVVVECDVAELPLAPGDYTVKVTIGTASHVIDEVLNACSFTVVDGDPFGIGRNHVRGNCVSRCGWRVGMC